jgi:hypothetical protein
VRRRELEHALRRHVADHDQECVVRRVPARVPVAHVGGGHRLEVGHPADDRPAVGVDLEGGRHQALVHERARPVVRAQAPLLLDYLDLARELVRDHD